MRHTERPLPSGSNCMLSVHYGRETVLMDRIRAHAGRCCGAAAFIKIYY